MTTAFDIRTFAVGDGATEQVGSDRYAGTIVRVSPSGHAVWVQRDKATLTSGSILSEAQVWEYEPDPGAPVYKFTRRRNGRYCAVGTDYCWLGHGRHQYMDPSF